MSAVRSGRHTLRWCPEAMTIVPRSRQRPGEPCPECGVELPEPYTATEPEPGGLDAHARRTETLQASSTSAPDKATTPYEPNRRRFWEGPLIVVMSLFVLIAGLMLFTPRRADVATVDQADLIPGMTAYERPDAGFAIALPETWIVADLPSDGLLDTELSAESQMPDATLGQFMTLTAPDVAFKLLAWAPDGEPGLSMISRSRARTDTVARVKYSVESALMWSYRILDPPFELMDMDGHDTLRFTYAIPTTAGPLHVVQYLVMRDNSILTVRFHSTTPSDPGTFDAIMSTLATTG